MKQKKKQRGISLITLVITIIVIIIISAAVLLTLFGDNGIIERAKEAVYANEFSVVKEILRTRIHGFLLESHEETDRTYADLFYDNEYMTKEYILNMSKLSEQKLNYGYGNVEIGDYYTLKDEKLVYVTRNKEEIFIDEILGFGKLNIVVYLIPKTNITEIMLGEEKEFTFNLTIDNFEDEAISKFDIDYEISMENKENSNFTVMMNDVNLNENTYKDKMQKNEKISKEYNFKVKQNVLNNLTLDKIILKINVTEPYEMQKQVEFNVSHSILMDSSSNSYNAELKNGVQIVKDEEGNRALSFDGIDDYVQIPELPSGLDWKGGINIEATVRYDEIKNNSAILLLSNGADEDYFILKNMDNTTDVRFEFQSRGLAELVKYYHRNNLSNGLVVGKKVNINVTTTRKYMNYDTTIYVGDKSNNENNISQILFPIRDISRGVNYLGRNDFENSEYFKGLIYYIKVSIGGNTIFEYNLNS